ncbi:MAG: PepSY-associated TM helix domain-containing protein [Hyphomicrobiaceae bacterium]
MRAVFTVLHRWTGLFIGVFLIVSGITGAIISWDHELDEWLNPHLFKARKEGSPKDPHELARFVEASDQKGRVTFYSLGFEPGHTTSFFVEPRVDPATGELFSLDYNQVYVEPSTGEIVGKRYWGAISLSSENILSFLYKLHYSMHIPDFANYDRWGYVFMGIIAIVWTLDCFVGFYLTLPARGRSAGGASGAGARRTWWERWRPAWSIKRGASSYRFNLDLHRATGLWLWVLLFILAFTAISMNLSQEVVRPLVRTVSTLTPDAFDDVPATPMNQQIEPKLSFAHAIEIAVTEARKRGWSDPPGSALYGLNHGVYAISFYRPENDHGEYGMGHKMLFVDGQDGSVKGGRAPWQGTPADVFMQLQFPLHSGRIAGIPGRIAISILGLVVALLSITGIVVWAKKRSARLSVQRQPVVVTSVE